MSAGEQQEAERAADVLTLPNSNRPKSAFQRGLETARSARREPRIAEGAVEKVSEGEKPFVVPTIFLMAIHALIWTMVAVFDYLDWRADLYRFSALFAGSAQVRSMHLRRSALCPTYPREARYASLLAGP